MRPQALLSPDGERFQAAERCPTPYVHGRAERPAAGFGATHTEFTAWQRILIRADEQHLVPLLLLLVEK